MNAKPVQSIDYRTPDTTSHRKAWARRRIAVLAAILLLSFTGFVALSPPLGRARAPANVIKCASNLRQIGQALLLYSNDYRGRYPDRLEQLMHLDFSTEVFICPTTDETRADTKTTRRETIDGMYREPGHCSYMYVGAGLTNAASADVVVAYEVLGHHPPKEGHKVDGSNVLFGNGTVRFVPAKEFKQMLSDLAAGRNSPPSLKSAGE